LPTGDPTKSTSISTTKCNPFEEVKTWFLDGHTAAEIREAINQRHGKTAKQADALIAKVLDHFEEIGTADNTVIRGWGLEAQRHLYQKMVEIGDYANAARLVRDMMKS
jgi:hypothetical protein